MNTDKELIYRLYTEKDEDFTRSNIKSEFSRYNDIKNGDVDKVKSNIRKIRANFYDGKGRLSDNLLRNNIYHLVISAGVIARVCIDAGLPHDDSYTLSDIYIKKADQCTSPDEVIDLICDMQLDYATRMKNLKKDSTVSYHIRNAIDFIFDHLHEPLTMRQLALKENLDPSYFSKLFVKETGVTTKRYIINAKITTAKNMLMYSEYSLPSIALSLGFSSQSAFTTSFKKLTGLTPGEFRATSDYKNIME